MHIYGRSVVKANDSWSWPPLTGLRNHPHWTHHTRWDSSGLKQWPLPDNTQHSQQTNVHATGRIRTHDRSRRAAADLRLKPRGYWDRHHTADTWHKSSVLKKRLPSSLKYTVLGTFVQIITKWFLDCLIAHHKGVPPIRSGVNTHRSLIMDPYKFVKWNASS